MSNLVSFFTIKYIHPRRIITNYSHICCVECAGFFVGIVKTSSCQFVGASTYHLPCISKVLLYCVGIHCSRIDSLTIFCAEYIYGCDMAEQQGLDTKPSLICKKKESSCSLLPHHFIVQSLPIQKPIQSLKQAGLLLDCIIQAVRSISSVAYVNHPIPMRAKIANVTLHTFLTKVEHDLIVVHHTLIHLSR